MKIAAVYPNNYLEIGIPTGLATIFAILKSEGHEISLFDFTFLKTEALKENDKSTQASIFKPTQYTLEDMVRDDPVVNIDEEFRAFLKRENPDLIIVSTMTSSFDTAIDMLERAKDIIDCKVLVGGVHPTISPLEALEPDIVDYICIGEGDEMIVEFCNKIGNNLDLTDIKNLGYKKENSEKVLNPLRPLVDLDILPTPDWGMFDSRHLFRPYEGEIYSGSFYLMSRGCPYKCTYCVNDTIKKTMKGTGKYFRFQSPKTTIKQLTELKEKYNATWFKFADDSIMSLSVDYLKELAEGIIPLGIKFGCSIRPETTSQEKVKLMKDMGMVASSVGVESGNDHLRRTVLNRKMKNEQIINAINILKDNDIRVSTFNMIGLPQEKREDVFETIKLNKELGVDTVNVYILFPYPGTKIEQMYLSVKEDMDECEVNLNSAHKINLSNMDPDEVKGLLKTFHLYLRLPYDLWPIVKLAEKDTLEAKELYECLSEYTQKYYIN